MSVGSSTLRPSSTGVANQRAVWRQWPEAAGIRLGRHLGKGLRERSGGSKKEAVFTVNWKGN